MVSFSCETCGDVLTKKKLDAHRGQCRGASFTCLDCMTHFAGGDYKGHTSCISEAQKYQGALYKEKPTKSKKSVKISDSFTVVPRKAYVEDAPDTPEYPTNTTVALTNAPPPAPSPPSAVPAQSINVFDFLVNDETPNASRVSLNGSHDQERMVDCAPSVFESRNGSHHSPSGSERGEMDYEDTYSTSGYTYGTNPIPTHESEIIYHEIQPREYRTPAPKSRQPTYRDSVHSDLSSSIQQKSTDKKRKRQVEELDLTAARRSQSLDAEMIDADTTAPPLLQHSGLTGGLNRLLSKSKFPPSPEYSDPSPIGDGKKTTKIGVVREVEKSRGRAAQGVLVKVRKVRRPSDESRPRKHHRSHRHSDESRPHDRTHSEHSKKKVVKAIEYPGHSNPSSGKDDSQQLIVYRSRAELFLSFVTKGPDSDRGCSVNKALKRYHRERGEQGLGLGKQEEEKELWKSIRLKRNERGEVVVIF